VLTLLNEGIAHLTYNKCNPFVVDGGIMCNMAQDDPKSANQKIKGQN